MKKEKVLLIGAGPMALEYAKVIQALAVPVIVVGRGKTSAKKFHKSTGLEVCAGGLSSWIKKHDKHSLPRKAMVVVSERNLGRVTAQLIKAGVKEILVEKPGGYDSADIRRVGKLAKQHRAKVYVAYTCCCCCIYH